MITKSIIDGLISAALCALLFWACAILIIIRRKR